MKYVIVKRGWALYGSNTKNRRIPFMPRSERYTVNCWFCHNNAMFGDAQGVLRISYLFIKLIYINYNLTYMYMYEYGIIMAF